MKTESKIILTGLILITLVIILAVMTVTLNNRAGQYKTIATEATHKQDSLADVNMHLRQEITALKKINDFYKNEILKSGSE